MHTSASRKEQRQRRARRTTALLVVLALLFTMLPTGFYTVAGAAPAESGEPLPPPELTEPLPEPEVPPEAEEEEPEGEEPAELSTQAAAGDEDPAVVSCYVAQDGHWHQVTTVRTGHRYTVSGKTRYYITAAELEKVYGAYGFTAADYNGELFFPHTDSEDYGNVWADTPPTHDEGDWRIPLSHRTENRLYYTPANREGADSYFNDRKLLSDETLLAENMFYTVTVEDGLNKVYDELPAPLMVFHGKSVRVFLKTAAGVLWDAMDSLTGAYLELQPAEQTADSVIYQIENISRPVTFHPHTDAAVVKYEAQPEGWQQDIGQFKVWAQEPQQTATVKGRVTLAVEPGDGPYTLLAPDIDRIEVKLTGSNANNRSLYYSFVGWRVAGMAKEVMLQPGTVLTAGELSQYVGSDGEVTLQAVWSGADKWGRPITAHFFLHLNGELRGSVEDGVQWEDQKDYTPSLYTTRMLGAGDIPTSYTDLNAEGVVKPLVARTNDKMNAYAADSAIRNMTVTAVEGARLEELPGEETIFAYLRAHSDTITMKVNGVTIPTEMLRSDHFQIRWNMVKYEKSDGWHIDGVLVAKRARFVVTKTFTGDADAIAQARDKFSITVSHTEDGSSVTDFTLVPRPAAEVTEQAKLGYAGYDAATDTYTWEVPAQQQRQYNIKETGHTLEGTDWRVSNRYTIRNDPDGAAAEEKVYPETTGITIRAVSYGSDVPNTAVQTVALQNRYVGVGTLSVKTQDSITGNGLGRVRYRLTRQDGGAAVPLYRKPDTALYSVEQEVGYEPVAGNTITADANGFFTIRLGEGSYTFTEVLPTGYYGPAAVQVTVAQKAGSMTYHSEAKDLPEGITPPADGWLRNDASGGLTILNVPRRLISVTARSSWPAAGDKLPVTVELWRDSAPLGKDYTKELNEENSWRYTWADLPLFTDGTVAVYTLRVTKIGDTYRDPGAAEDGFADYLVTYAKALYRETGEQEYREEHWWQGADGTQHFAQEALLVVNNEGIRGQIAFEKADEKGHPLKGAEFTLYADEACTDLLAVAVSDENGDVQFEDKWPAGTYYLRETAAPTGYTASPLTWRVKIAAGKAAITTPGGTAVTKVKNTSRLRLCLRVLGPQEEPLPGAVLRVTLDNGSPMLYTTAVDGAIWVNEMPAGDYIIRLAGTPTGYAPESTAPNLQAAYGALTPLDAAGTAWQLEKSETEEYTYLLTLRLKELHVLPSTGGAGTAGFALAGAALMGMSLLLFCRRKKVK